MDLATEISDIDLAPDLADALRRVVARHGPEVARQPAYLSVRPQERHIAAYFNKGHVDVVVDPLKANGVCARHPGTSLSNKKTSTTAYPRVPSGSSTGRR